MENKQELRIARRETRRACRKTVSRCNFSTTIYLIVASLAMTALITVISGILGPELYEQVLQSPLYYNILLWSLQVVCMYLIGYPFFHLLTKHLPKRDISEKENLGFGNFIGIFIMLEGVMLIGSIVANYVTELINKSLGIEVQDSTGDLISQAPIGIIILVVVIIGPIFEELVFRKIFVDTIGKYSTSLAILVSAASFALFHGNITQIIYTFGAGLILAWVYAKTKRIIYPIIFHMLLNFFGSIPSMLIQDSYNRIMAVPEESWESMMADPAFMLDYMKVMAVTFMQYGFMFIGGIILISMMLRRQFKIDTTGEVKIGLFGRLGILVFNRGTLLFLVYTVITVLSTLLLPLIEEYMNTLST